MFAFLNPKGEGKGRENPFIQQPKPLLFMLYNFLTYSEKEEKDMLPLLLKKGNPSHPRWVLLGGKGKKGEKGPPPLIPSSFFFFIIK